MSRDTLDPADVPAARALLAAERDRLGLTNAQIGSKVGKSADYINKLTSPNGSRPIYRPTWANIAFALGSAVMLDLMVRRRGYRVLHEEHAAKLEACEARLRDQEATIRELMRMAVDAKSADAACEALRRMAEAEKSETRR